MSKVEDSMNAALAIANRLSLSAHGIEMQTKRKQANAAPAAEHLSEVNESHLIFPHKYLRQYEALKLRDPIKAEAFYNQCLYDPRPKAADPLALEKKILSRIGQPNQLKRRI